MNSYNYIKRTLNYKLRFFYLAAAIAFFAYIVYASIRANELFKNYKFDGTVEKVAYDVKNIPNVTVNGENFYLGANNWSFDKAIEVGDTFQKDSGTLIIKLIKYKTGKVILFR